jgi:glucose/arabinose dehydrogenase
MTWAAREPGARVATLAVAALTCLAAAMSAQQGPRCAPDNAGLTLARGVCALVVADSLGRARHLTVAPNGDVFVAAPGDGGGVLVLRDSDGDGVADIRRRIVDAPQAADVRLRTTPDGAYLYYSTYHEVVRFRRPPGALAVEGPPDTIVRALPGTRQHGIKTFTFGEGSQLFVNVGAPSNSCQEQDRAARSPGRDPCPLLDSAGGIWLFDADRMGQTEATGRRYATGLRNTVALAFRPADGTLYGVVHGRDQLGASWGYSDTANAEKPAEKFVRITEGADFGWPYCYYDPALERLVLAPEYGGDGQRVGRCREKQNPIVAFPAHWAPDGLLFYAGSAIGDGYRGGAFVAFHGSWNRAPLPQQGFKVVFVPFQGADPGTWQVFADGFEASGARPVDVAEGPDGSLYVSDDRGGRVYRILVATP